jgi:hypothetical protein
MRIDNETLQTIRLEMSRMVKVIKEAQERLDNDTVLHRAKHINGTQESVAVQSQFKMMKYNIGKSINRPCND